MIDQRTDDESKFWDISPAAAEIFGYLETNKEISESPWGFDRGMINRYFSISSANFSCRSTSGWGKNELVITAKKTEDGVWEISHSIVRA